MSTPKIRFREFTDAWEQRKLGKVAKYRNGKAHESDIDENGEFIVVNSKFVSTDGKIKKYSHYQLEPLVKNEIAFVLSDVPNGRAIAKTFLVDKSNKYTLNQRIAGISPLDNTYPYFLHILMNRNKYFLAFDDGVKQTNLSVSDVMNFEEYYPRYDEQNMIGKYFENMDNLIILHQRKCDELQKVKQYMLQKMFPKKGEKVPEIRFAGFTGDWEQRKFGEFAQRQSETRMSDSDIPCVEYEDVIAEQGLLNKDIRNKEINKTGIAFSEEDVLYGKLRPYLHNWLNPDFKGVATGDWWVLKPKEMDKNFLYRLFQTSQFDDAANQSSGTKMPRADWKLISNLEFLVPNSIEEQAKVGKHFNNIDTLITLHQRKHEALKEIKKYMLQNMFPKK
ncbi:restriction endonuclease subunit S [Selenomonas ruminantium]|uniref:restriction endonuclease subunit S n=1 Tax=Selenomonas ruminantium TaxID=971 RepID=UPI000568AD53|nr:restriction endonuclease subunit S [Selenomonas ruminantium]